MCEHGLWVAWGDEYCDACETAAQDAAEARAARVSHDQTPMLPPMGGE